MAHPKLIATLKDLESISGSFYVVAPERYLSAENRWQSYDPREESTLSYSQLDSHNRHVGYGNLSPAEMLQSISDKKLWRYCTVVFCPDYFTSGDYCGSLVELSNLQTFLEDFKRPDGIWELYGGYGSSGLALDLRFIDDEIMEDLASLQSYPVRSEDHLSALELDKEREAWESYLCSDFKRSLERRLPDLFCGATDRQLDTFSDALDAVNYDVAYQLCLDLAEQSNTYWETEGISRWIDCDRLADSWDTESALDLLLPLCSADLGDLAIQQEVSA